MTAPKIEDIQALRGIAVLMVVFHHLSISSALLQLFAAGSGFVSPLGTGVELFFVISGYVVTLSLMRRYPIEPGRFLWRRAFRLYPAMIAFVLFSAAVLAFAAAVAPPVEFATRQLFGLDRFVLDAAGTLTGTLLNLRPAPLFYFGAMWSLSVEFQFYFAFAIIALLIARTRAPEDWLLYVAAALLAIAVAQRLWMLAGGAKLPYLGHLLHWRFDFLLVGVILALVPARPYIPAWLSLTALGGALLATSYIGADRSGLIQMAAFAIVVWAAAQETLGFGKGRLRDGLAWVGDRSYSLYLLHMPVIALCWVFIQTWFDFIIFRGGLWAYSLTQAAFTFAVALPLSHAMFRYVEQPMIGVGAILWPRRRRTAVV